MGLTWIFVSVCNIQSKLLVTGLNGPKISPVSKRFP
jgi:hypothetical protein